jgi:hypothetical protein
VILWGIFSFPFCFFVFLFFILLSLSRTYRMQSSILDDSGDGDRMEDSKKRGDLTLSARFDRLVLSSDEEHHDDEDDDWVEQPEAGVTYEKLDTSLQKVATILPATKKRGSTIIFNEIDAMLNDDNDGEPLELEEDDYGDTTDMMAANMRCLSCNAQLDPSGKEI